MTKIMRKTVILTFLCFDLLIPLKNVEKQSAKFTSNYVMGWRHCIAGEGES